MGLVSIAGDSDRSKTMNPNPEGQTQAVFAQAALPPGQPAADKRGERVCEREWVSVCVRERERKRE